MAKLTPKAREALPGKDFVFPDEKEYPIHDEAHARNALARVSQYGSPAEKERVASAVRSKFPEIEQEQGAMSEEDKAHEASESPEFEAEESKIGEVAAHKEHDTPEEHHAATDAHLEHVHHAVMGLHKALARARQHHEDRPGY